MIATQQELQEIQEHIVRKVKTMKISSLMLRATVFVDIVKMVDREFGLYEIDLDDKYLYDVHEFIDCYELPLYLEEKVEAEKAKQ